MQFYGISFMHLNEQTDRCQNVLEVIMTSTRLLICLEGKIP